MLRNRPEPAHAFSREKNKRKIKWIPSLIAALGLAGAAQAALTDGAYEVSVAGNNGPVVLQVEIAGGAR